MGILSDLASVDMDDIIFSVAPSQFLLPFGEYAYYTSLLPGLEKAAHGFKVVCKLLLGDVVHPGHYLAKRSFWAHAEYTFVNEIAYYAARVKLVDKRIVVVDMIAY